MSTTTSGRPSNVQRRAKLDRQVMAARLYAKRAGLELSTEGARRLLARPGDPFAFLDRVAAAVARKRAAARTTAAPGSAVSPLPAIPAPASADEMKAFHAAFNEEEK
ncbi:MAG: hypothetical protein V7607_1223 [Solirubrobacteraceae bacterium]